MAAEVPLPSAKPPATYLRCPVRTRPGRPASVSHARSRAHQTPFCARGLQKIIAVSENAPGAHGIVPRHCSTRAAGMSTSAARPPPRNLHSEAPAAEQPLRHSPRRNAKAANSAVSATSAAKPPPRSPRCETSATRPPPRNPRRNRLHREVPAAKPPRGRLYLDAKSSRARPASSTARSTALSLM